MPPCRPMVLAACLAASLGWLAVFGVRWVTNPTPGVTRDTYLAIASSMRERRVEALLGGPENLPPLDDPMFFHGRCEMAGFERPPVRMSYWQGNADVIAVGYDADRRVVGKVFYLGRKRQAKP